MCVSRFSFGHKLLSLFYIIKFFHLKSNLNELSSISLWHKFAFMKYSVLQYLFLGFLIAGYKLYSLGDKQQLPPDFKIYYQMIVTATTIGYGDVCPQSRNQMIYFTCTIPIICLSFCIYFNHISDIFNETFANQSQAASQVPAQPSGSPSFFQKIKSLMSGLSVLETAVISYYMLRVFAYKGVKISIIEVFIQIGSTMIFYILSGMKSKKMIVLNLLASCTLLAMGPIKGLVPYKIIIVFYFIKLFHVQSCLFNLSKLVLKLKSIPHFKYINFIYTYLRYSLLEYLFLAFTIMAFKIYSHGQAIVPNYKLYYQWLVTSATIGYGDITPKTDNQIVFMTLSIPIICYSFVIYINHLTPAFKQAFLLEDPIQQQIKPIEQIQ